MINLEDGRAVNMGDTIVIQQTDGLGVTHSVVVSPADLQALAALVSNTSTPALQS